VPSIRSPLILSALLLLAVFLVHLDSLHNGFHYDDGHSIVRNPHIRHLGHLPHFFTTPQMYSENPDYAMYRPAVLALHSLNYAWTQYQPWSYHLVNLLLHGLVCLLVFHTFRVLGLPSFAAFAGALFFGLHPVQTEPINYISSRSESLSALFYLLAFFAYLKTLDHNSVSWRWHILSLASLALALFSKEISLTFPLLLLAHAWFLQRRPVSLWSRLWPRHLPYWLISGLYTLIYQLLTSHSLERAFQVRSWSAHMATQAKALVHYIKLAFAPLALNVHQQFFISPSALEAASFIALLFGLSLLSCLLLLRNRLPLFCFGLIWFALALLPTFIIPLHILVNDHRLYLPLIGLALALVSLLPTLRVRWPLYLLCSLLALLSYQHTPVWRNALTLWQNAAQRAPLMPEAHYNLGHAHHLVGNLDPARHAYEHAIELSPRYVLALTNLGAIYREQNRLEDAIKLFKIVLQEEPHREEALNNLGLIYVQQKRYNEGIRLYQQILERSPNLAETWLNLGLAYRDLGQREQAAHALMRAIQLKPDLKRQFPMDK
jgi:tetratricopeptide (TPR) repeat protein